MGTSIKENIANNITKYFEISKDKKRADLAARLNTTVAAISRFCLGQSTPTVDQLVEISEFFEITLYQLFGIEDNSNLDDNEIKIIKALRDKPSALEYVNKILEIK